LILPTLWQEKMKKYVVRSLHRAVLLLLREYPNMARKAKNMKNMIFILLFMLYGTANALADELNDADAAVANILFDYEGSEEFATYIIKDDGFVDITFARNMPDKIYGEILTKLKSNQAIKGVLAGRGGPICRLW